MIQRLISTLTIGKEWKPKLEFKSHTDVELAYNTWVEMDSRDRLHIYLKAKEETGIESAPFFTWPGHAEFRVQKYKNKFIDFLFPTYEYQGSKGIIIFAYLCNGNWKKRLKNLTVLEKEFISKLNRLLNDKI